MNKQTTLILSLLPFSMIGICQSVKTDLFDGDWIMKYDIQRTNNFSVFDSAEIKERNFKSVFLVKTTLYDAIINTDKVVDTLIAYHFGKNGETIEQISFEESFVGKPDERGQITNKHNYRFLPKDTFNFKKEKQAVFRKDTKFIRYKNGNDSIIKQIIFFNENSIRDTSQIFISTYDKNNNLIELQKTTSKAWIQILGCTTGAFAHFKYAYDTINRLIYFEDIDRGYYRKYEYTFFGKIMEEYSSSTNKLINKQILLEREANGALVETDGEIIFTTVNYDGQSKLPGRVILFNGTYEDPILEQLDFIYVTKED